MATDESGIGQVQRESDCKDFNEAFQTDAVKIEKLEIDLFTNDSSCCYSSGSERDFVDIKNSTDSYQEQSEEKLDMKNWNPDDSDHFKFSENSSTSKCNTHQIKSEEIDIFCDDIKRETVQEETSEYLRFCEICFNRFVRKTDFLKSTSYIFECRCQEPNKSVFFDVQSENMIHDVKPSLGITTDPGLQGEAKSGDEVSEQQDSCAVPLMNNISKIDNKLSVDHKRNDMTEEDISCKFRLKSFSHIGNFKVQEKRRNSEKSFPCQICSKSFSFPSDLKIHERTHTGEKPFHCKICSKSFTQMCHLKVHEKGHTGEKPFYCPICSKSFTTSSKLRNHRRIHTGEKPFCCKTCSKAFTQSSNLREHEMIHAVDKAFPCKTCSNAFSTPRALKIHERIHTREKPFHCKICSKSFSQMSNLKVHEQGHTGEKPFHCKICSKLFRLLGNLKVHERSHTGEKPFCCKICSKAFTYSGQLKSHEKIH